MFATSTKPDYAVAGPGYASAAIARLNELASPHVAIGGITADNVGDLRAAGVQRVAVCQAILSADDIAATASQIKSRLVG